MPNKKMNRKQINLSLKTPEKKNRQIFDFSEIKIASTPKQVDQKMKNKRCCLNKSAPIKLTTQHHSLQNRENENKLRRSKRIKLDNTCVPLYAYETIEDYAGKQTVVSKLVGVRSRLANEPPIYFDDNKQTKIEKIISKHNNISRTDSTISFTYEEKNQKEHNKTELKEETISFIDKSTNEIKNYNVYSYNNQLDRKEYHLLSEGVCLAQLSDNDGILKIYPNSATKTRKNKRSIFYVVRKGSILFSINGFITMHHTGEVIKIPANFKYKIKNLLEECVYLHYQLID